MESEQYPIKNYFKPPKHPYCLTSSIYCKNILKEECAVPSSEFYHLRIQLQTSIPLTSSEYRQVCKPRRCASSKLCRLTIRGLVEYKRWRFSFLILVSLSDGSDSCIIFQNHHFRSESHIGTNGNFLEDKDDEKEGKRRCMEEVWKLLHSTLDAGAIVKTNQVVATFHRLLSEWNRFPP